MWHFSVLFSGSAQGSSPSLSEILSAHASAYDLEMLKISQEYLADKFMEDTDTWGLMKDEVWDNYAAFLQEYGVIDEAIPASQCYTNEFLPQ